MSSAIDQEAETFVGRADKILRCLATGGKDTKQLALATGLEEIDAAKAIHYLREQLHPPFVKTTEINDTFNGRKVIRHHLTEDGKRNLPSPEVPKWNSSDVNPRVQAEKDKLAKVQEALNNTKKNAFAGLKHVDGMSGKARIDAEGRIQLGGAKGAILEAVRNWPKISTQELIAQTGLHKQTVWSICSELVSRQLLEIVKDGNTSLYREIGAPVKPATAPKPENPPPETAVPSPAPVYRPAETVTDAVRALLIKHEATDILLALVSELDAELKLMREFKNRMQSLNANTRENK